MKRVVRIVAGAACVLAAGASPAADLSAASPLSPAPVSRWTGFYGGISFGYGWSGAARLTGFEVGPFSDFTGAAWNYANPDANGVIGGGGAGYDYQLGVVPVVIGAAADIQGAAISGSSGGVGAPGFYPVGRGLAAAAPFAVSRQSLSWYATLRGRLGYAVTPELLIYGTGGWAIGGAQSAFAIAYSDGASGARSGTDTPKGWAAGGGLEYALSPNWSIKGEYLYLDFGQGPHLWGYEIPAPTGAAGYSFHKSDVANRFHTIRIGVNYRLELGGLGLPATFGP